MKLLIIIVIGGLIVWMFYEMAFKHQGNGVLAPEKVRQKYRKKTILLWT